MKEWRGLLLYGGDWLGTELWALDGNGNVRWTAPDNGHLLGRLDVTPDESLIVATGTIGFGKPSWFRAHDTADGSLVWHVESSGGESLDSSRADESNNSLTVWAINA